CACARRIWHLLDDERSRRFVELAELCADGLATQQEVTLASYANWKLLRPTEWDTAASRGAQVAHAAAGGAAWAAAWEVITDVRKAIRSSDPAAAHREVRQQRWLLEDMFGNPFEDTFVEQSWLRWNDGTVPRIAQGIYEERAFDRLPILHDALLDAGCDNERILAHCRATDGHVRGCWVIDLLLGKE